MNWLLAVYVFNVPGGNANMQLSELCIQADIQSISDFGLLNTQVTAPVRGRMTVIEALDEAMRTMPNFVIHIADERTINILWTPPQSPPVIDLPKGNWR